MVVNQQRFGCVSWSGQGVLTFIEETLRGQISADLLVNVILETFEILNMQSAILVQDHTKVHSFHVVEDTKYLLNLRSLEGYLSNSPDLDLIESIWRECKDRVLKGLSGNLEELVDYAFEERNNIDIEFIRSCLASMPQRLYEIISNNGRYINIRDNINNESNYIKHNV